MSVDMNKAIKVIKSARRTLNGLLETASDEVYDQIRTEVYEELECIDLFLEEAGHANSEE